MKIFALIPDSLIELSKKEQVYFNTECSLGCDDAGNMTLIVKILDNEQKVISGIQFIADLTKEE